MSATPSFLTIERRFEASPEHVFDAWLLPEVSRQWLFRSGGERVVHEIDACPGGAWRMTDRREGEDYTACGEYLKIDRPYRLVFTFAMPRFSPNEDRISVELRADGGSCLMNFSQQGFDIAAELRDTPLGEESDSEQGWKTMFDELAGILGR